MCHLAILSSTRDDFNTSQSDLFVYSPFQELLGFQNIPKPPKDVSLLFQLFHAMGQNTSKPFTVLLKVFRVAALAAQFLEPAKAQAFFALEASQSGSDRTQTWTISKEILLNLLLIIFIFCFRT